MKIGYIIKYFHPLKGGAENNILNLALRAATEGHEVHVFTSNRKGCDRLTELEERYNGIRIHRSRVLFNFTLYFGFYPSLLRSVLKTDLDVIHASGFGFVWHDVVMILKKLSSPKTRFINTPHGPFMALSSYNIVLRIIKSLYTIIQKLFLGWLYDFVIQVNSFQWRWITTYGIKKDNVVFVPNGISESDVKRIISKNDIQTFKKKYELKGKRVMTTLGRISKYKGIQHVIEILPKLTEKYPDLEYIVMGRDDGYARSLKALAEKLGVKEHVRFIINVSEEEKYIGLNVSDIMIFPSEWEAFGIVLLEAMSQGNAVVSSKTEGGKFLIVDRKNGFLYDFGNIKALQEALTLVLDDPQLLSSMQRNNKLLVHKYTWDTIYSRYYRTLLEQHKE